MVDMEKVRERLVRGAFVGVGSFASSFTGGILEQYVPGGDMTTGAAQVALGLGVSVGADEVFSSRRSIQNDALEYVGYGIQGAGFANVGETLAPGAQTGRVVNVSQRSPNSTANNQTQTQQTSASGYSLDTA